ncbi:MAG: zinc-dependent alcohol dehydrogenase [Candidatus Freyarchaeota archaeon]
MKALVYYDAEDIRYEEVEKPKIGAGEALIEVKAAGLCSTDVWKAIYRRSKPGSVLGHEVSGVVAEVGSGVKSLEVGDRVAVYHRAECGLCYYCKHGQEPLCRQYRRQSIFPGAFSEYIRVLPEIVENSIIKLPKEITHEMATMIEPTGCSVRAVLKCGIKPGDRVLVIGDGPLGLLNAQVSKASGASTVILSGHHDYRLEIAKKVGVDYTLNSSRESPSLEETVKDLTDGLGADVVIVAVASTEAVREALRFVREGGKICLFGDFRDVPQPNLSLDLKRILRDDVQLIGSWGCSTENYRVAFNMVKSGLVKVKEMITHRYPMEKFKEALQTFFSKECMKIILNP